LIPILDSYLVSWSPSLRSSNPSPCYTYLSKMHIFHHTLWSWIPLR
jgi:hypothetical protein